MMASYSASLLEAEKSRRMACFMTSQVRALSCNPCRLPFVMKHHLHSRSTSWSRLAPSLVEESLLGNHPVPVPSMLGVA